ncbi:MAG: hypothetical protein KTR21_02590 [Rhodobacteraceae bacterium]|nr:hypothetical protein [Paracoccaceae bacterium]
MLRLQREETVLGRRLPPPRLTPTGARLFLTYVGLPFLGVLFLIDLVIWAIAEIALDRCLAIWCLW